MSFFSVKMVDITHDSHKLLPLQRYLPICVIFEVTFNNVLMTCYDMLMSSCKGEILSIQGMNWSHILHVGTYEVKNCTELQFLRLPSI